MADPVVAPVAVVGDALLDVHVTPDGAPRPGADVPAIVRLAPGGQGANLAVRLARRGVPTRLTCALGDDPAGRLVGEALANDGVELETVTVDRTGAVVVLLDGAGERTMLSQRVAFLDGIGPFAFEGASWLVVSGYLLLEADAAHAAASFGRAGRRVVVGCALRANEVAGWASAVNALAPSLVVINRDEAHALAGDSGDVDAQARRVASLLGGTLVVTTPSGATAVRGEEVVKVEIATGGTAIDTTGAGDAFAAALISELLDAAWPPSIDQLADAMRQAGELASAVTRVAGAQGRVPSEGAARLQP